MRILEVIQSLGAGGAERLVVDLCNEMSKSEDVFLLLLKEASHFYLPQVSSRVHVIQAHIPIGKHLGQFFRCYKIIKSINPDIVHFHSHARYTILPANLLLRKRFKFYMTIHSDVKDGYKGVMSGLQVFMSGSLGKTKFITISDTNYQQFNEVYPYFSQKLIKNGRAFPCCSKSDIVRNEIALLKHDDQTIVFVHVARCAEVKNQALLIESFNRLIDQGHNAILLIIGPDFNSDRGKMLKSRACSSIHFLGEKENIYDYLLNSDCFLLSSLVEGMPMSIIEALLAGIPVISTPVCGAIDAIENGTNGFISSDFSVNAYTETLQKGIQQIIKLKSTAKAQAVNSPWGIDYCATQYLKWFRE